MPCALPAATVVKFGAVLCGAGQHMASGACTDIVRDKCPSGYYQTLIHSATYASPSRELKSCMNSYDDTVMSDWFYPIYNGVLVSFGATLCNAGEQFAAGECQPQKQGRCESGFYQTAINGNTFSSPSAELNECMNSYHQYTLPEFMSAIYNGVLVNFGATLCGAGQYLSDGTCVSRDRGECPENFVDITVSDTTMAPRENSECTTGYKSFWLAANCASNQTQSNMCATLCDAGLLYAGTGACQVGCSVTPGRIVTLKSLGGFALPLYSERISVPSLNIETSAGDVCYGNLAPGAVRGAINVTVSGQDYHITD